MSVWRGVIDAYRSRLPVPDDAHVVTLGEGGTPLIHSERLSARTGLEVWLKFEGANPTGSFKDRGMTVAITCAVHGGAKAIVCASTGNTSASASAYAARAGITCAVLIPGGKVALGKLAQAMIHGARVVEINANFDAALDITRKLEDSYPITLVNSINPLRIEGQKTGAFEVCDALGHAPDYHLIPVGNAGNITSYWKGYSEYLADGTIAARPKMFGFQAEGSAPIVKGHPVTDPMTIATAIRIGNPASWEGALAAAKESGGQIRSVRDKDILFGYRLAAAEGLFCEMASAASVAGLLQLSEEGVLERGKTVVCVLTGHGLKDTEWALAGAPKPLKVEPNPEEVAAALGL